MPGSTTTPPLLCLFGQPALLGAGAPLPLTLKYRKGLALLGFLAAHAERVFRRETLAELLWPDIDSRAGRANLRQVLADLGGVLRRLGLAEALEVQRDWLALHPGPWLQTDVAVLSQWRGGAAEPCGTALLNHLSQATTTWLEDAEDGASDDFREWLGAQRHHLQHARERLLGAAAQRPDAPIDGPGQPTPNQTPTPVGAASPEAGAPQIAIVTLLRVALDDSLDDTALNLFSTQPQMLELVRREARCFDGWLLDHDDAGCTLAFGLDSQHTGQRWQALRCACSVFSQLGAAHRVRMGVTTGKALLLREHPPRVMGWRRQLADRLALAAEAGELVCDDSLLELGQHLGATALGSHRFRGLDREFQLYRRRLSDTRPWLLPPGGDFTAGFFGREAMLEVPTRLFEQLRPGYPQGLSLRGEPGVGKSRMAWEFAQRCQAAGHPTFWIGGLPEAVDVPWRSLRDFFSQVLTGSGTPEQQLERAFKALQASPAPESRAAILGLLRTHGVPQGQRNALSEGLSALLRGQGRQRALVVIDDAQWLDAASAEVLNRTILHADAVLWLMTSRTRSKNPLQVDPQQQLELQRLDDATAAAIVRALPDADLLSEEALRQRIADARGLPLYLLADSVPRAGSSHFDEFCQALLNQLGAARGAIEAAAVLGLAFRPDELASLCGADEAAQALERALASGLLIARGTQQVAFFHPRLREHLLSVIVPEALRRHARQGAGLLDAGGRPAEAARLWEQAGETGPARHAWHRAALQAKAEDDILAACSHCANLGRLGYLDGVEGVRARVLHANCLIARDGYGSANAHEVMAGLDDVAAQTLELDQHERFSLLCLSYLRASGQSHEEGLPYGQRMQASAETPTQHYLSHWAMSNSLFWLGRFAEARVWFERSLDAGHALSLAERMTYFPSDPAVFTRAEMAWMLWLTGDWEESRRMIDEAEALALASVTRQDLCIVYCFKGLCAWLGGEPLPLAIHAAQALEIADAEGFTFWRAVASLLLAMARAQTGEPIDLAPLAKEADTALLGYRASVITALWFANQALLASGQPALALQMLDQTLDMAGTGSHAYCRMDLWRLKAEALALGGRADEAQAARRQALALAEAAGAQGWLRRWRALLAADPAAAPAPARVELSGSSENTH